MAAILYDIQQPIQESFVEHCLVLCRYSEPHHRRGAVAGLGWRTDWNYGNGIDVLGQPLC